MWIELAASSLGLAHGLTPWPLSQSLQPPSWHPKTAAVLGQGECGLMSGPCWVPHGEGPSHAWFPLLLDL